VHIVILSTNFNILYPFIKGVFVYKQNTFCNVTIFLFVKDNSVFGVHYHFELYKLCNSRGKHVFTMFCRHFYQYCTTFYNIDNIMLDKYPLRYRSTYDVQRRKCLRKIVGSINELYWEILAILKIRSLNGKF